jgi:two-component sensor histidine kinase
MVMDQLTDEPLPPYITLYPAIVIASFTGGLRVGIFALLASGLSAWLLWIGPDGAVNAVRVITGALYLFTAIITVFVGGLARMLLDQAAANEEVRDRSARESVHRIKNLLAVTQSISRKIASDAPDVKTYRERLDLRLRSLAVAQDVLLKRDWADVQLRDLIRSTLGPFLPNKRLDLRLEDDAPVPSASVAALSMALYELATNSMKYGALASPEGLVRLETRADEDSITLDWREIGLAHVAMGESAGLGSALIRSALNAIEGGTVMYDISPESVSCVFQWPTRPER